MSGNRIASTRGVLGSLFNRLFGCSHRKTSFPLTSLNKSATGSARRRATYVTCLECGVELEYDWERMRTGAPISDSRAHETRWAEWRMEREEIG